MNKFMSYELSLGGINIYLTLHFLELSLLY